MRRLLHECSLSSSFFISSDGPERCRVVDIDLGMATKSEETKVPGRIEEGKVRSEQ